MTNRGGGIAALICLGLLAAPGAAAEEKPVGTVFACVPETGTDVRFVTQAEACGAGETPVRWKARGPAGPAGPAGPRFVVEDANGGVIGEAFYVHPVFADVRVVHIDEEGREHGYPLRFSRQGVSLTGADPGQVFHDDPACADPAEYIQSGVAERFFPPAFSRTVIVVKLPADGGTPALARITGPAEEKDVYLGQRGQCQPRQATVAPITILIEDLRALYPAPYRLIAD